MKVVVTGGCGFIGSHLVDKLIEDGHDVINIDNCSANNEKFYFNDKAKNYNLNILDIDNMIKLTKKCDFIFHLAAESRLQHAIENPKKAIDVNINGTHTLLECCKINNIKGLLFSSTSSIYGLSEKFPITEEFNENCLNPYASTKYAAELLIKNYNTLYGIKSCIFRYFNVFGERAPSHGPYALATSIFIRQYKNKEQLTIVGDGLQKRDFIHVKDVVAANIICMENWNNPKISNADIFNICSGKDFTILEIAKTLSDQIIFIENRKGEAKNNLGSYEKIKNIINWNPTKNVKEWLYEIKGNI